MDSGEPAAAYQLVIGDDQPPDGGTKPGAVSSEGGPNNKMRGRGWKAKPYCQNTWSTRQDGQRKLEVRTSHVSLSAQQMTGMTLLPASARNRVLILFMPFLRYVTGAPKQGCEYPGFQGCISHKR